MKKKILLSSIVTIALCLSLIAGSTFALFTSQSSTNIAVTAGTVSVVATIDNTLKTWSLGQTVADARTDRTFENGGVASIAGNQLTIDRMTPGDTLQFTIQVTNYSNVEVQYRVNAISMVDNTVVDLSDALVTTATINGTDYEMKKDAKAFTTPYVLVDAPNGVGGSITSITVTIAFPNGNPYNTVDAQGNIIQYGDNHYQGAQAKIAFTVEAVQGNGVNPNNGLILP